MQSISSIKYVTLKAAKAGAERAGLFNVRYERKGTHWRIVEASLEAGGRDIANDETAPTIPVVAQPEAKSEVPASPSKEKKLGVVHTVREFVRAHPDMPKAEVVDYMVKNHGINKATAAIQFVKVKRGEA